MSDIKIRTGNKGDIDDIIELLKYLDWHSSITQSPIKEIKRQFNLLFDDYQSLSHEIFVAVSNNKVVGYITVHLFPFLILNGREGHISELFVHNNFTGQGIGTSLMNYVKSFAIKMGCSRLTLVNRKQRASYQNGFYIKKGWKERDWMANFVLYLK